MSAEDDEEIILIENYNLMHKKIRQISYWHFIFTNNNKTMAELDDNLKVTKKFRDELTSLLPEKESEIIFKGYIKECSVGPFIRVEDFSNLIKDLSIRVCSNVLNELSKLDVVYVVWDESVENFAFQINPEYLDKDIRQPKQFLKHVYGLAKTHLKLKDHSQCVKRKKK
jgi:hypothetical protein